MFLLFFFNKVALYTSMHAYFYIRVHFFFYFSIEDESMFFSKLFLPEVAGKEQGYLNILVLLCVLSSYGQTPGTVAELCLRLILDTLHKSSCVIFC